MKDTPEKRLIPAFGKRLRQLRKERKLSQERLALIADCNPAYIGMVERGEKAISLRVIEKICRAMEIPPAELFQLSPIQSDKSSPEKIKEQFTLLVEQKDSYVLDMLSTMMDSLINYKKKKK